MAQSIFKNDLFKDKIVLVTGGASGIGAQMAHDFAELGATVVIASRKAERCFKAAKSLSEMTGSTVIGKGCNIRENEACQQLLADIINELGGIDVLINNGGGQFMSPAEQIRPKGWNSVIETNLTGTWNMIRAAADSWMLKNGGLIINITMLTQRGWPGMAHSVSARAGVEALTKTLAVEWAPKGIRINAIQPGIVASSGVNNYPGGAAMFKQVQAEIPLKRLASCNEIAQLACFLASPAATYITGQTWTIDGGRSLWGKTWPVAHSDPLPEITVPKWPWEN